jgi:acyl-CoA synthetase (AMP-forming)/AMP-acid ligase II
MLYQRWRDLAGAFPNRIALRELATSRSWTFQALDQYATDSEQPHPPALACPQGRGADFILSVLRAWRSDQILCPLEPDQSAPALNDPLPLPSGIVHLKTTSATAGVPRFVAFTADQLMADAANIVATMGLRPDWPNLGVISLAHSYGFSNLVLPLLLHGIPITLLDAPLPEVLRRAAALDQSVTIAAVPALWRAWLNADAIPPNVRLAISAAAPLPLSLEQSLFDRTGLKLHNFYGSSECGGIAYDGSLVPREDESFVGSPLQNVQIALGPDDCLEVRGAAVGQTYWPTPAPELRAGTFRTSDLAHIEGNHLYLRGRASDQINIAGRKVAPETIEHSLSQHPAVKSCLAFGVPSPEAERGETIVACVHARPGSNGDALRQYLITKLPAWQIPRDIWFVDSLEANERGKLSRDLWRKRYLEKRTTSIA